ncbi:hypothetical protein P4S83_03825 [Aneurinibacillus thermoaerophilus]|uniref:hypothetical protein n=1 Tax=Aneurinibacillus thermoaerophilus TaxID=143495 RepID=UPI002E1CC9FB|nr:hypothetical protein [Aneurinibacillus thermoaerophilus]MED0678492.1 hypothetical protein [Aneurinibacillus thermoaerophilus]MED0763019.1 hypothetical protein [Aneurinibacillus thermoaerophilus]
MKQFVSDVQEQQLVEQAKKNKDFNILLKGLIKDNILLAKTTAFTLKKGETIVNVLEVKLGNIKVLFTESEVESVFGSKIEKKGDIIETTGYKVIDNQVSIVYNKQHTENEFQEIQEIMNEKINQIDSLDNKTELMDLPCIYGNYCGPKCGSGTPISPVDWCCKHHDDCYANNGYFNCECDRKLIHCLAPYVYEGSEWAIIINAYFLKQYEYNCT